MYQLEVVASRIEDVARNTTRFLVIGKDEVHRTGNDKTSIMFVVITSYSIHYTKLYEEMRS